MIMTKTPMMAPIIPRFTFASFDRRADPQLQNRPLNTNQSLTSGCRAAGSGCHTIVPIRFVSNSLPQGRMHYTLQGG